MRKYYLPFLAVALIFLAFLIGRGCKSDQKTFPANNLKQEIVTIKQIQAKIKDTVIYKEKIRQVVVTKWKEIRRDSLIPCPEKLLVADTVIYQDSSLITSLRSLVGIDSLLISKQDSVISDLRMQLKKRFWKGFKIGFLTGNATGIVVGSWITKEVVKP